MLTLGPGSRAAECLRRAGGSARLSLLMCDRWHPAAPDEHYTPRCYRDISHHRCLPPPQTSSSLPHHCVGQCGLLELTHPSYPFADYVNPTTMAVAILAYFGMYYYATRCAAAAIAAAPFSVGWSCVVWQGTQQPVLLRAFHHLHGEFHGSLCGHRPPLLQHLPCQNVGGG
jgi:hypothetical protein